MSHENLNWRDRQKAIAREDYEYGSSGLSARAFHFERNQKNLRKMVRTFNHPVYRELRLQAAGFKPFSKAQSKLVWAIAHENGFELPE